jgi:hypothetical protein
MFMPLTAGAGQFGDSITEAAPSACLDGAGGTATTVSLRAVPANEKARPAVAEMAADAATARKTERMRQLLISW